MEKNEMKFYSLAEMKDRYIGKEGTKERDEYEYELQEEVTQNNQRAATVSCIDNSQ